jgi:hypothetical protein
MSRISRRQPVYRPFAAVVLAVLLCGSLPAAGPTSRDSNAAADDNDSAAATKPASQPASRPAKAASPSGKAKKDVPKKYQIPTDEAIAASRKALTDVADRAREEVGVKLHSIETPHFVVFSCFDKANDKGVAGTCEDMYKMLCKQFDVADDETVYVGKCGIFLLGTKEQFAKFAITIDKQEEMAAKAAGYFKSGSMPSYIVMNAPLDKVGYKTVLVHESTHAFLWRYISDHQVPLWLNEGIADASASALVPSGRLPGRLKSATKHAIKDGEDVMHVFKHVELNDFDYGIAQSWVQFLIARDHKAFIKFVTLCKEGKDEADAMQESYKLTRDEFVHAWAAAASRGLGR